MPQVVLTHDDVLADFVTIGSGARLAGGVPSAPAPTWAPAAWCARASRRRLGPRRHGRGRHPTTCPPARCGPASPLATSVPSTSLARCAPHDRPRLRRPDRGSSGRSGAPGAHPARRPGDPARARWRPRSTPGWARVLAAGAFILGPEVGRLRGGVRRLLRRRALRRRGQRHRRPRAGAARRAASGPATRSSCRPTPSSPRPRPSARTAPGRCSSTAIPTHLLIDPDRVGRARSPAARGRSSPCTSTARWPRSRRLREVVPARRRRSSRTPRSRRARPATAGGSGSVGAVAGDQLLPRQEPRRLRRRRARCSRRRRDGGHAAGAAQPRRRPASTSTTGSGMNSRLDTLQAVVLRGQARAASPAGTSSAGRPPGATTSCSAGVDGRRAADASAPATSTCGTCTWCGSPDRDAVLADLQAAGIGAGIHYPQPIHLLRRLRDLGHGPGAFPVAERLPATILSLPALPRHHGRPAGAGRRASSSPRWRDADDPRSARVRPPPRSVRERRRRAGYPGLGLRARPARRGRRAPTATSATTPSSRAGSASATG